MTPACIWRDGCATPGLCQGAECCQGVASNRPPHERAPIPLSSNPKTHPTPWRIEQINVPLADTGDYDGLTKILAADGDEVAHWWNADDVEDELAERIVRTMNSTHETPVAHSIGQRMRDLLVEATPHGLGQRALDLIREWDAEDDQDRNNSGSCDSAVVGGAGGRLVVGEPLAASCYVTSGPHLSGYRVSLGFDTLEKASAAHQRIIDLQRCAAETKAPRAPTCFHAWVGDDDCPYCRNEEAMACFVAAEVEGWSEALAEGDLERLRDVWDRRLGCVPEVLTGSPQKSTVQPTAPAAISLASKVSDSSTDTAAGAVPTCAKHGVELAFEGDECWACKEDES